ncbi:response regulator [Parvularcula sp. ZS-1/3]|uniref:histidine kinase n=1 Tax=Parvularcula mediterranea TaxID=2732508 RepID=A0A7Y3RLY7_9PROT|nr:response regulator [Parvularcula mediterranea]NNU16444.1 response regulator [Parvularcula mediterranea]
MRRWFHSIAARIFLALGVLSLILLGYGAWSVRAVGEAGEIVRETYDRPFQALNYTLKANANFNQIRVKLRDGDPIDELREIFHEDLDVAEARVLSNAAKLQIEKARAEFEAWLDVAGEGATGDIERERAAALTTRFDLLTETMTLDSFRERQRALEAVNTSRSLATTAITCAMLLAILMSVAMSRQIARPLKIAADAAHRVAEGDFKAWLPEGGKGEIGDLLRSMKSMQASISAMIAREEERSRSAEVRMADAFESAGPAIMIVGGDGGIIYKNSRVSSLFPEEDFDTGGPLDPAFLEAQRDGEEIELGEGGWVSSSRSETRDGETIVIWTDITAIKNREVALRDASEKAQAAAVAKSNFVANMSHEIRTPMNGVLGLTEVLQSTELTDGQSELVSLILSSGTNLMSVINAILDFSKLDAGKMKLASEPFNLRQTVTEVGAMMQASARQKGIELIVRYAPSVPEGVEGDEARLRQVLGNLCGNAVKFTSEGHVLLNVEGVRIGDHAHLTVEVRDTGIGISPEDLPRMFHKFEQADDSKSRSFEGTGLGLAISKELVDLMGGDISATSEVGEGSCFTIKLKLPVNKNAELRKHQSGPQFDNLRVLAVDDNPVNRLVVSEFLKSWEIECHLASSGKEAEEHLSAAHDSGEPIELILMDFHMPQESGDEFTGRIQKDPRFAAIPVIMLSSVDTTMGPPEDYLGTYADWVSKPIGASRLFNAMMKVTGSDKAPAEREAEKEFAPAWVAPPPETPKAEQIEVQHQEEFHILLAEDNAVNQMVIKTMLATEEVSLTIAENGAVALELYQARRPDIFLTDLSMPVMDGLTAAREVRRLEEENGWPRVPIIAATAHVLNTDRALVREAGIDDFIPKPIKKNALIEMIAKWKSAVDAEERSDTSLTKT